MGTLQLEACRRGLLGDMRVDDRGYIAVSDVAYCFGAPSESMLSYLLTRCKSRVALPMSEKWRLALVAEEACLPSTRWHMQATPLLYDTRHLMALEQALPEGYSLCSMNAADVQRNPFGQGRLYRTALDYEREGLGCAALWEGQIVSAASSQITAEKEIEVEIDTLPEHRGKGLARACAAGLIRRCILRGITPRWDAQDDISRRIAEDVGYQASEEYTVFHLPALP